MTMLIFVKFLKLYGTGTYIFTFMKHFCNIIILLRDGHFWKHFLDCTVHFESTVYSMFGGRPRKMTTE